MVVTYGKMSSTSIKNILQQAYEYVIEDHTFLRLTTISTLIHSMIFVVIVLYNLTQVMAKINYERSSAIMKEVTSIAQQLIANEWVIWLLIIVAIILALWYYIFPPIGEAAMIHHLEKSYQKKSGSSFAQGMKKFFVMFERNSLLGFISVSTWLIILSRVWILGIFESAIMLPIIIIYSLVVLSTVVLTPYVKFKLVVEEEKFGTAITESIGLALAHPMLTFRLVLVWLLLYLRIILNIIILVWVPAVIFYIAFIFGFQQATIFYVILTVVVIGLFMLIAYINSIVEAFLMAYWYLGYRMIESQEPHPIVS